MSRSHQANRKEKRKEQNLKEKAAEHVQASRRKPIVRVRSVALAVAAVALAAIGISNVAGSSGQRSSSEVEREVSALLSGIPQNGDTLGQASAPITLQIFGDLESEDVRTFVVWILPDIIHDWVRTSTVKIQYRSFMNDLSHDSRVFVNQQVSALAAGTQDKLWNFIETFYHEQGKEEAPYVTEKYLENIAEQVPGLSLSQWKVVRESNLLATQVIKDDHAARARGFHDAPAFLIGRAEGELTPWLGYRLYEEPGERKGSIWRALHPLSLITNRILKLEIEHLP